jgi:hypothetical protein
MILVIFSNLIVGLSALFLVQHFFGKEPWADKLLLSFTIFLAQIISVGLVLGVLGRFYLREILLFHCVILVLIVIILPWENFFCFKKLNLDFIFNNKLLLFALAVFVCFFTVKFFVALINPPIFPDSLAYHLYFPASWIKHGNLVNPFYLFGGIKGTPEMSCPTYFPINAQLFFAWLMLPLRNAFLAGVGQAPFYLVGILAVYAILRKFSLAPVLALFSGLLWVLIPNLFKQLKYASMIDVIIAVLFLLVLNSLLRLKNEFNFKNALVFGITAGIFLGTKILDIVWLAALLPLAIYYFFEKSKGRGLKMTLLMIFTVFAGIFIFGAYTYLNNFIHSGNPFFPIQTKILGHLFPGILDSAAFNRIYLNNYAHGLYDILFSEGLGVQLFAFILPGTIFPLLFYKTSVAKLGPKVEYLIFFATPLFMTLAYYLCIKAGVTRYFFPYLGMALITAVVFLNNLDWGKRYIAGAGLVSVIASSFELAHGYQLVISLIFSLFLFAFLISEKNIVFKVNVPAKRAGVFAVIILTLIGVFYFLSVKYSKEEFSRYSTVLSKKEAWQRDLTLGWKWLDDNTAAGRRIAAVGRPEIYPLLGSNLKNEVLYVPVNNRRLTPYDTSVSVYRINYNVKDWLDNLANAKIDFLFIALPPLINAQTDNPKDFPVEDQWAIQHPERFNQVFQNSLAHIYKLVR